VDHACSPEDLTAVGRDTETVTLSRAVRYHIEHRIFLNGSRTVVFK
jgi:formyltetrahydrofolate deformylase